MEQDAALLGLIASLFATGRRLEQENDMLRRRNDELVRQLAEQAEPSPDVTDE